MGDAVATSNKKRLVEANLVSSLRLLLVIAGGHREIGILTADRSFAGRADDLLWERSTGQH